MPNPQQPTTKPIEEVRFLADYQGTLRKICKLRYSASDLSLYLVPYAPKGEYLYKQHKFPAQQTSDTFNFREGSIQANIEPHLTIHESGLVQVYSQGFAKAGPLWIPRLPTLSGGHLATVTPDAFESLPVHEGELRKGRRVDRVIPVEAGADSGKLVFYVNGQAPIFAEKAPMLVIPHRRPTYNGTLFIGVRIQAQPRLGVDAQTGTTVIAGWNPNLPAELLNDFLYIRGE